MLFAQGLKQFARSRSTPERRRILIGLKNNTTLALDVPDFGVAQIKTKPNALARILLAHAAFRVSMQPDEATDDGFVDRCAAEVNAIALFFPDLRSEAIHICFTAWLAFVCVMDDFLETLPLPEQEAVLIETIEIVLSRPSHVKISPVSVPTVRDKKVQGLARALVNHCTRYLSPPTAHAFLRAASNVLRAHIDEVRFLEGRIQNDLPTYMSVRSRTIALDPFFEVLKREYLPAEWQFDTAWENLQLEVGCAAGLQNDLIGLGRDLENGEQLNAVIVLLRALGGDVEDPEKTLLTQCIDIVTAKHNQSVIRALDYAEQINQAAQQASSAPAAAAAVTDVVRSILLLSETHLRWCSSAKRYHLKAGSDPWIQDGGIGNKPTSDPNPTSTSSTSVPSPSVTQMVQSRGIIHGLPVYASTPETQGLTAIVTGATGVSGYQLVKVLAASPSRWSKIYCLSSRPPPPNFYSDLLDPSSSSNLVSDQALLRERVIHIQVDFFSPPEVISRTLLAAISTPVDHVFYFSYHQPPPKSDSVLDLWADPDRLSSLNSQMFTNFLSALSLSPQEQTLRPRRRFLLQTGTKHYAFYLGPARVPALESDPRVPLCRNFYYEQEDALARFCRGSPTATSCRFIVARPSYVVGAVRDGTLNHLLGMGIYASVQRRLGARLEFPGGYDAWTREQVQSTGMLNAYFEEWCALAGDGVAGDEAFNIHDGGCFTWGRAWEMLAGWYGVGWEPPADESDDDDEKSDKKYRVVKMVGESPRGYGPQATLKSTFSLLEWSLRPEVEAAWRELAAEHDLVLDPFDDRYRARIFSFADSALIGDAPMTTSIAKARKAGFFGTVDSYHSIFQTFHDMARLKLIVPPVVKQYES